MADWNRDQAEQPLKEKEGRARTRRGAQRTSFNNTGNRIFSEASTESGISRFGNGDSGANFNNDDNLIVSVGSTSCGITGFGNMNHKKSTILFLLVLVLLLLLLLYKLKVSKQN